MASPHLDELGERLGIVLRDPEAIRHAFVHSSFFNENPGALPGHNERLEFLGDAVIGHRRQPAPVRPLSRRGRRLPDRPPRRPGEPRLARRDRDRARPRSATCCSVGARPRGRARATVPARRRHLRGAGRRRRRERGLSAHPALAAQRSSPRALLPGTGAEPPKSAKSRLQEWTQRHHRRSRMYELIELVGPAHRQAFTVDGVVDGPLGRDRARNEPAAGRGGCRGGHAWPSLEAAARAAGAPR